jgi:outer membrane protein
MKILLTRLAPVLLVFAFVQSTANAQFKMATVDLGRTFTNYWKTKEAGKRLQELDAENAKIKKEMFEGLQKAQDDYKKLDADARDQAVSVEEREKRKKAAVEKLKDIEQIKADLERYDRRTTSEWNLQYMKARDALLEEIRAVVNAKAKTGGFALVIDASAQTPDRTPIVLYSTADDITESVVSQINANAPIEPRSSPAKPLPLNDKTLIPEPKKPELKP